MTDISSPKVIKARKFAIKHHGKQSYGSYPYVHHLDRVYEKAWLFQELKWPEVNLDNLLSVAYLHDVLEGTAVSADEIYRKFGLVMRDHVVHLTREPGESVQDYLHKVGKIYSCTYIKLCARISNVEEVPATGKWNLLERYRNDHEMFKSVLFRPNHKLGPMWWYLENLLNTMSTHVE